VNPVFTQNLVSTVLCSFNKVKGRFASALDIIERVARGYEIRVASSGGSRVQTKRSGVALDATGLASDN
jgi:hypothetical protein